MPDDVQGAADSPQPDAQAASSAEVVATPQVSEPATPPTSQPGQEGFNLPPKERWEALQRERDEWRLTAQQLAQRQPPAVQPAAATPTDQWEQLVNHPDPATAQFWQQQRKLQEPLMQRVIGLERAVETGTRELAEVRIENFRLKNPDITPNSEEEKLIAGYVNAGYPLEAARKMGLFDLHYGKLKSENDTLKGKQSLTPQKVLANATESSAGIPQRTGLPQKPGDWRDNVRAVYRKGATLAEIANAAGMSQAT